MFLNGSCRCSEEQNKISQKQMHVSVWNYIINTVCFLQVTATHVAILRKVPVQSLEKSTYYRLFETIHSYTIQHFKILHILKYILRTKIHMNVSVIDFNV